MDAAKADLVGQKGYEAWQKKFACFSRSGGIIVVQIKSITMKTLKSIILGSMVLGVLSFSSLAGDSKDKAAKLKPYPLETCVVSGEKLGEMGKPHTFDYKGQEIKLCCKNCLKDFNKEPAKYIKKMDEVEARKKK
jgi:YHS domain-containing protein